MKNNKITGGLVIILTVVIGLLLMSQWSSPIAAAQQPSIQYRTHVQILAGNPMSLMVKWRAQPGKVSV